MAKNYLIDFTFRNLCFMNFVESSSMIWKNVIEIHSSKTELEQQKAFIEANNNNLLKYKNDEEISSIYTPEKNEIKTETIRKWARKNSINLPKDCSIEDINSFIDKSFYPKIKDKIISLKNNKDPILRLLFHHLVNNFFSSVNLLIELKKELYMNLKNEKANFSRFMIESNDNEKKLKSQINQNKNALNKTLTEFKKERNKYEEKIKSMEEEIVKLKADSISKKNFSEKEYNDLLQKYQDMFELNNSLFMDNEMLSSDIQGLKNENKALKIQLDNITDDFNNKLEKEKINFDNKLKQEKINLDNKLKQEKTNFDFKLKEFEKKLNEERDERIKMNNEFIKDKERRMEAGKNLIEFIESNNRKVLDYIKKTFNIQEEK